MELMIQLKQILRRLGRTPIFTAVTLLTLAVSIGATGAGRFQSLATGVDSTEELTQANHLV